MHTVYDEKTEVFIKAYRSFLKAEGEMSVDQFSKLYQEMDPALHRKAGVEEIDIEAFIYAYFRLPSIIHSIKKIILAPTDAIFRREGYDILSCERVTAAARRRKMYYDGKETLCVFINSVTDVDDIVTILTAYQIEWNKIQKALHNAASLQEDQLQTILHINDENWERIKKIWGGSLVKHFEDIQQRHLNFKVKLLRSSYVDYHKAAQRWLEDILTRTRHKHVTDHPIYFVSSNTHSLVNSITGWVNKVEDKLIAYLKDQGLTQYLDYWNKINTGEHPGSKENFLWYVLKKYEKDYPEVRLERVQYEQQMGIDYIEARHYLDIDAQVIAVCELSNSNLSQKLGIDLKALQQSNAYIVNIDYPLGFGAYMVLSTILKNFAKVKGAYILGKASFLHGNLGDIALPTTVYDSYSQNTFIFRNAFTKDYFEGFKQNNVLVDQRAVSAKGTLVQSEHTTRQFFIADYTLIEMENGSYLNALYETTNYERYPEKQTINLLNSPIDIGIIHYASDTPFTKAITLGTRNLGYEGVEATYAASLAILKRILNVELHS